MINQDKNSDLTRLSIWGECQEFIPERFRVEFNPDISFCIQERDFRNKLKSIGREDLWYTWKKYARPLIYSERAKKYSSSDFLIQKKIEYDRRADDWHGFLENLLLSEDVPVESKVVNVGSHDGEEVNGLNFDLTCIDISNESLKRGKNKFRGMKFAYGTADNLPLEDKSFDAYLSFRTWCVAGVLVDEALDEALRILKSNGLIVVSFPLNFLGRKELIYAEDSKVKPVAGWAYNLLREKVGDLKTLFSPEDFLFYGKI
jgi:SAM-dependent methyltransferase